MCPRQCAGRARWRPFVARGAIGYTCAMASGLVAQVVVDDAEDARRRARFPHGAALVFETLEDTDAVIRRMM